MAFTFPSLQDFKNYFTRDFPYGIDPEDNVLDQDILKGMQAANAQINQSMWGTQDQFNLAYLLLSAHFLVIQMRASSQGLNGQFNFLQQGKSAGISESFGIPQEILNNPTYSVYSKTNYGAQFLMMALPRLKGVMFSVRGHTKSL